jgi:uncharacterized iron-regulated protein
MTTRQGRGGIRSNPLTAALAVALSALLGCAMPIKTDVPSRPAKAPAPGTIISARSGAAVGFEEMLADLLTVDTVYIGEQHTDPAHHAIQRRMIDALAEKSPRLAVGMEMFDRSYQGVLARWSDGRLDEETFLRATHWYANWRYDFGLYREILETVRDKRLPLVALNIPFCIPPKIRVGGIEYLSAYEKAFLPAEIDTTVAAHRAFAERIFSMHSFKGEVRFEDFYLVQCVWEEAMAQSVAENSGLGRMVVLAGNGHIQYKYGIPERTFRRTGKPYRTLCLLSAQDAEPLDPALADYLWITE